MQDVESPIGVLRKEVEKTDESIVQSLAKRQNLVKQISQIKLEKGMDVIDLEREKFLFEFYGQLSDEYQLEKKFIEELFRMIISYSRRVQEL